MWNWIMHCWDYEYVIVRHAHARSCRNASISSRHSQSQVCSFGANLLHLGNVDKQVYRRFLGLQTFHVKHIIINYYVNRC